MTDMIERVARAISPDCWDTSDWTMRPHNSAARHNAKRAARAAIEAMREPTDAMVQAGINEGHKCGNWYPAMIDAALQPKE